MKRKSVSDNDLMDDWEEFIPVHTRLRTWEISECPGEESEMGD
jgi:hypothetical protein